MMIIAKVYF